MNWEQRLVLENVKNLLNQQEVLPSEDGFIDFDFLSTLERIDAGKLSLITRGLIDVFAEDRVQGNPARKLEELASFILLWAAQLRAEKQKFERARGTSIAVGARVQLRLPDHFPLFIGEICDEGMVYIPVLQKKYAIDDVQVVPMRAQKMQEKLPPVVLQEELRKSILEFQKYTIDPKKAFIKGDKS